MTDDQGKAPEAPASPPEENAYDIGDTGYDSVADATPTPQTPQATQQSATSEPPVSQTPAASPKHSARLRRMATDLGLSEAEIDGHSPEALDELVYHLNKQQLDIYREFQRSDAQIRGPERADSAQDTPQTRQNAPGRAQEAEDDLGIENEADYDQGLIKALKKVHQQNKTLQAEVRSLRERDMIREAETTDQTLDRVFADLADERFGKGPMRGFASNAAERRRRQALVNEARHEQGSLEERVRAAYKLIYGDKPKPEIVPVVAPPLLEESKKAWNAASLARPTQRNGAPEPKGDKRALETAGRLMKEHGLIDPEDELLNGFPG